MNVFALSGLINCISSLFFGAFVFFRNKKSLINKTFVLLSLSTALWSFGYWNWMLANDSVSALRWIYILSFFATLIPIFYLHWILTLLDLDKKKRKILIFGYIITFLLLSFSVTKFYVQGLEQKLLFPFWPIAGPIYILYILVYLFLSGYGCYQLLLTYKKSGGYKHSQIIYVLLGSLIGFGGGISNFPLWYNIKILPVGNLLVFFYPLILAYAIIRYRLMDIRFALGRGAVYGLSLITIIGFAFSLMWGVNRFSPDIPSNVASILILIISILFFQYIFRFFEKFASKWFYYTFYSSQKVLTDLGRGLTRVLDLDTLSSLIVNTLINTMKLDRTVVLLREPSSGEYRIQKNIGFKEENGIALVKDSFLTDWLEKTQTPLVSEEISLVIRDTQNKEEKENLERLQDNMKNIEAALCLPLLIEEKIIGMIVLGNKISGDPYSSQDIDLLINLTNQASIAFQNAKLYSETKGFSKKMEKEVEDRTKELKEAYEELKKLDKAKSEFLSIASHQLRTPLTAIKGYISMMLEKTYGKPPEKMTKPLENIYASNERLIKLINDLLNISRIETGKIEMKIEEVDLEELIKSVIEELKNLAKEKKLYLKFEKAEKPLPEISVDKDKIRQVILNIIDNAIRYTKDGGVTVKIQNLKSKIQIIVSDTGEGMTKEEISNLFESFSRGTAGNRFWTEGAGLGLYIAKKFINLHHGEILAESKGKGKGSTFILELPIK